MDSFFFMGLLHSQAMSPFIFPHTPLGDLFHSLSFKYLLSANIPQVLISSLEVDSSSCNALKPYALQLPRVSRYVFGNTRAVSASTALSVSSFCLAGFSTHPTC